MGLDLVVFWLHDTVNPSKRPFKKREVIIARKLIYYFSNIYQIIQATKTIAVFPAVCYKKEDSAIIFFPVKNNSKFLPL